MRTLSMLRHAKSSWDDPELDDHERPLAKRGARDAPAIGAYMAREKLVPDLVLCSTAVRTRATLTLVLAEIAGATPEISYEDGLYLAEPRALVERLRRIDGGVRHALLIGHNPGLHALALSMSGAGDPRQLGALATKLPTAGLVVLNLDIEDWSGVKPRCGFLRAFVTPKLLG